jgi:HAD superfamily hydrolase (TIGR01549 family)
MPIEAIYFDIGETLVDRSREYAAVAHELGVTPHTFSAVFGAVIAGGGSVDDVFARFGLTRQDARGLASVPKLSEADLYPDARRTLAQLRADGLRVSIVGNQPAGFAAELRDLELPADEIATSADWGVAKPDPAFFARVLESAGRPGGRVAYVGDQLDNDIAPALAAGLQAVRIRRGPWGALTSDPALEARCLAVIDRLDELPPLIARLAG